MRKTKDDTRRSLQRMVRPLALLWDSLGGIILFWAMAIAWWCDHRGFAHGLFSGLLMVRLWTQYHKITKRPND